jgi:hypothetical protein
MAKYKILLYHPFTCKLYLYLLEILKCLTLLVGSLETAEHFGVFYIFVCDSVSQLRFFAKFWT